MIEENEKAINTFLDSKKGTSKATQKHYTERLNIFLKYLNKKKVSINKFNQDNLIAFFGYNYDKYKPKTMNHIKAVVSQFLKFQFQKDYFSRFPNLTNVCKGQKVIQKYESSQMLKIEEIQTLIQKENDPFWKLIIALQFYGGCRPTEICLLKWKDVTIAEDGIYFNVYSAKNNQNFEKFVPIEYSNYIKELKKTSKSEYCFVKKDDKPITQNVFYKHLWRLSEKALGKRVNPYLLRHSIATILYGKAEKGELHDDIVARQLGHTKSMKAVYAQFDLETMRDNAKKIFIKPDYTPEKKAELEKQIIEQQGFIDLLIRKVSNKITESEYKNELGELLTKKMNKPNERIEVVDKLPTLKELKSKTR
jgi:integrase